MLVNQIDTRQGTNSTPEFSHGNTLPYTGIPFGMNYFIPQTTFDNTSWSFSPMSHQFAGIKITHQPSPWIGDFSDFIVSAITGDIDLKADVTNQMGSYRPDAATFNPHYLSIYDQRYETKTQVAPTTYGALLKYTFDEINPKIIIHIPKNGSFILNENKNEIKLLIKNYDSHFNDDFKSYASLKFSNKFISTLITHQDNPKYDSMILSFNNIDELLIRLATSFISYDQAHFALKRLTNLNFESAKKTAQETWQYYLDLISVSDYNTIKMSTFYHCLYRTFLFPQRCFELDSNNNPIHYDLYNDKVKKGYLYMNNGFWDTSKTVYPLFAILIPKEYHQMLLGFYNSYLESGYLPKWLAPDERGMMPGTLIDAVIADAAIKGILTKSEIRNFLKAMLKSANQESHDTRLGRMGMKDFNNYGYLPSDKYSESVNQTLDYAYSDFCISQVAKLLYEDKIAQKYSHSALNYQNLFDPKTGLMRPKDSSGNFKSDFNAIRWGTDYTEGSSWQNSFSVYHDINGLKKLYQNPNFIQTLLKLSNQKPAFKVGGYGFQIHEMTEMVAIDFGQIAISNQPSFHLPYLFEYTDHPEYTELLIKQLVNQFDDTMNGFPGDEDNGSMSAWFIFSCLGFYPVCPGSDEYVFGIPIFNKATIHLPNGKQFNIKTNRNCPQNQFVQKRMFNDQPLKSRSLKYVQIINGGNLDTELCLLPYSKENIELPFSLSN
ncbi:GH92 family glycosyl hydrolase [Companilactobacillus alimentarius]|uniref:GH92 family glycosyl hydrolase n=1 Tax=Companilactobacillus alimentarius TaxID=1602 RepID=UPI0028BA0297|nr:GH92 family glycosyl hydrolase [Companilactobacillus alimentarius]MDT6953369.1 GH92 family glycosyl hydrolase [Companilactobacillus alimentarius]